MGRFRRWTLRILAGALSCLALALAAPLVASAAGSFALFGEFAYDDVYGVFGDTALMSKTLGTTTDGYGNPARIVQEDLVGQDGVLVSTVKVDAFAADDSRETDFYIYGRASSYFTIYSTDKSEQGEGKQGLLSYDGKIALNPVYETLSFSGDESLIATAFVDEGGATVRLLDAETLQTVGEEMTYPEASDAFAYFREVGGKEVLHLTVYEGTPGEINAMTYVFSFSQAGFGEDITGWATNPSMNAVKGVSSTGEEFSAYVDANRDFVIECGGNAEIHPGPYPSFGFSVYGDYVIFSQADGEEVYTYKGEPTNFFEGYSVHGVLSSGSSYLYLCSKASESGLTYVLVDGNGEELSLPEGYQYSPRVAYNYLLGYANNEIVVFDANRQEVYRYNYGNLTTDNFGVYLSRWDNGFLIGHDRVEDDAYSVYNVYLDENFNLIEEGWDISIFRAANEAKLPDGSDAFVRWSGSNPDYGTVLGSDFEPVTNGGYELVVPGNPGQDTHYRDIGNSISRAGTDWYYARDPETGKFGAVDASGAVAISFEYDSIVDCDGDGDGTLIMVRKGGDWSFLDTAQAVDPEPEPDPDPEPTDPGTAGGKMHRLYNQYTGEHFYTVDDGERDRLVSVGWTDEGQGWVAPASGDPVYRLYNPYVPGGDHHYTLSEAERDMLKVAGWQDEGVGWYSAKEGTDRVPLYRQYNPYAKTGTHNYTTNEEERDILVSAGWEDEGVAWYGVR